MYGINEQDVQALQNLKQNDTVCVRIYTDHGPYWDELKVNRLTKTQIITSDNQRFWKKDGTAFGGKAFCKRIYPLTEELVKIIEKTKSQHDEARQKRKLIFKIKRCNLNHLPLDQLTQISAIMNKFEKGNEADVKPAGSR
jgi:hypothetical protein